MQIEIQWTREDLERKLLEELAASGFRTVEELDEEGNPRPKFKWTFRPSLKVIVKAEPDPGAILEPMPEKAVPVAPPTETPSAPTNTIATATVERTAQSLPEDDVSLDPTMFPPGTDMSAIHALEKAAKAEKAGKPIRRRLMKGESFERPEPEDD